MKKNFSIAEANLFVFHGPRRIKLFDVKTMLFSDLPVSMRVIVMKHETKRFYELYQNVY